MAKSTHYSLSALAYAKSLLELASEQNSAEATGKELSDIREIVTAVSSFANFLSNPGVNEGERAALLERVLGGSASRLVLNFLGVLNAKSRLGLLAQIADAYDDLLDQKLGKVEVDVTVAQKLEPGQLERVRLGISTALKKDAIVHQYVDDAIIGGLVLQVEDQLIDASVRYQLEAMKQQLLKN